MQNAIGETYKKTIYSIAVYQDYHYSVVHVTTSKLKVWNYITKYYGGFFYLEGTYGYSTIEVGAYTTFTKALDGEELILAIPASTKWVPARGTITINTFHV